MKKLFRISLLILALAVLCAGCMTANAEPTGGRISEYGIEWIYDDVSNVLFIGGTGNTAGPWDPLVFGDDAVYDTRIIVLQGNITNVYGDGLLMFFDAEQVYVTHDPMDETTVDENAIPPEAELIYGIYTGSDIPSVVIPDEPEDPDTEYIDATGLWRYRRTGNGNCIVTAYLGTAADGTDVTCPDDLEDWIEAGTSYHVVGFDDGIFKNMTFLVSVTLPDDTASLGKELFYGCTGLTGADLGDDAETLSQQTFYGCYALTDVSLPAALKHIESYAFGNCTVMTGLTLPGGLKTIGSSAFYNCSNLVSMPLPTTVQSIGNSAFSGCNSLIAISLPNSLTSLGTGVFTRCSALSSVTIGSGLGTIDGQTFRGLPSLKTLTLNTNGTTVQDGAFSNCPALQTVVIRQATLGSGVFSNDTGLKTFSMTSGYMSGMCFSGCSMLETVTLGSGVSSLPYGAFRNLPKLASVTMQGNLTYIPSYAFANDAALTEITIPATVNSIADYAFSGCTGLTETELPDGLTAIGSNAFTGCTGLTEISIPAGVATIGTGAFSSCGELATITFGDSAVLETISGSAFSGCAKVLSVHLPESVTTVGAGAFPTTTKVYCDPSSAAAKSISRNGGSFVSPDNEAFGVRWILDPADDTLGLGLSVEQIWTTSKTIVIPERIGSEMVTEIGRSALTSCLTVENVTFPASVPQIPNELCKGNDRLVSIVIPTGVTNIGTEAFANCSKLNSVSLPATLTRIEARAFDGCELLATVTLSDNIREIGENAFSNTKVYANLGTDTAKMLSRTGGGFICPQYPELKLKYLFTGGQATSLEVIGAEEGTVTIEIPDSVTSIAAHAFENNITLQNVTMYDSVTAIGEYAFNGSGIKAITLPESITKIPDYAFCNTPALTSFTAEGVITEIGDYAFYGSSARSLSFAEGLTKVGGYAFANNAVLTSCSLPDSVTEIGSYAFANCRSLTAFTVPAGVKTIGYETFRNTVQMETIQLPDGLESIGNYAFYESGLASITIPGTVKTIGNYAFRDCQGLKRVSMSGDMTSIGYYAFYYCENLETVTMPATLQTMGYDIFSNCRKLKDITLPDGLNTIPSSAFSGCTALTHVKIGNGTVVIGDYAFSNCSALKSVELPTTLVSINSQAFANNYALTAIKIPNGVTTIGENAFYYCESLEQVSLPDSVVSLGNGAFEDCSALTKLKLSSGLTTIPNQAFYSCTALTMAEIPDGVKNIASEAFAQDTALTAVSIPESVTSIDETAFDYIDPEQLTVYCYENSTADSYAQGRGFQVAYLNGANPFANTEIIPLADVIYISPGATPTDLEPYFEIQPAPPVQPAIQYTTDNAAVADIVNDTELAGIATGNTAVHMTLTQNPNITASIPVLVRPMLTDFSLENPIWQKRDTTLTLEPVNSVPAGVTDGYSWTIDHELGQINGNVLTPTAFGTGTLTATSWNGITKTTTIHIYEDPTEITFADVPAGMDIGMDFQLEPQVKAGAWFTGDEALHFITYSSNDDSIATVDAQGHVTATGYGTAVISATADNGCTGTANIHVSPPIDSFNLQTNMRAPIGVTIGLAVTEVMPENANLNAFSWSVDPAGLAEYHNGKVTVLTDQECEVHITATSWNGISKTTDLYIYRPDVTSVTIQDVNEWNWIPEYSDVQMTATVEATNTFTNQLVNWQISGYSSDTINWQGVLHTSYSGHYIHVTAEADNGVKDEKNFYVARPITEFTIAKRYTVQTGETITIDPQSNYDSRYRMSVGTPALARVDGMHITGLKPGRTELTVTSWNGITRKAEVLVYDPIEEIEITRIESLNGKTSLSDPKHHIFATMNFRAHSAASSDKTYTDDLVTWTSSNPAVIRVLNAQTGEFRTVTFGEATLTATAKNGVTGSIDLHVYKEVDSFKLPDKITAHVLADEELETESYLPTDAYDGFVWSVDPNIGTVEGQTLHVTADQPTTGTITCWSWDGFITHTTALEIIREPVTAVTLEPWSDGTVDVGGVYPMTAHVTAGAEYINTFVTWSSSDEAIATVDGEGRVTALAEGTVTITATAADNEDLFDSITLEAAQGVDSFSVPETVTIYPDEEYEIEITDIQPADAADRPFLFTSADEEIITVENGVIRPLQWTEGEATVTVASWNGVSREINVKVKYPQVTEVQVDWPGSFAVSEQKKLTVRVTADGQEFENRFVQWSSDDPNIITVDENGVATAHAAGYTYIYAWGISGGYDSQYIEVNEISSLNANGRAATAIGGTANLRELVNGWSTYGTEISGENLTLSWASSDESIATVAQDGTVTGVSKGTATITASYTPAGLTAEIPVEVLREATAFDLPGRITVAVGAEAAALPALNMAPEGTDGSDLVWSAEPEGIVAIENGMIRALTDGDAEGTITASNISGTVTKSARLTVYSPWVDRIELEPLDYLPYYGEAQITAHVYAGDDEFVNQLVTFKAYYSSDMQESHEIERGGYGSIDARTGIIRATQRRCTYYIVATAENGVQATMEVESYPEYTDFTVTNPLLINVDQSGDDTYGIIYILSNTPISSGYGYGYDYGTSFLYSTDDTDKITLGSDGYVYPRWKYDAEDPGYYTGISTVIVSSANGVNRETKVIAYREKDIEGLAIAPMKVNHPIYENITLNALAQVYGEEIPGNPFVTWSSDAPEVISVNVNGVARARGYGTATITATTANGLSASVTLNVLQESSNFTLPAMFEATCGETILLDYESAEPEDAVMELSWAAEPADTVTIEGNELTPTVNEETSVTLTATNWDGTTRTTTLQIHRDVSKLITMNLPAGLREIDEEAFAGIAAERVVIPDRCTTIGTRAFADSKALQVVHIPESVTQIDSSAFDGCDQLTTICGKSQSAAEDLANLLGITFRNE